MQHSFLRQLYCLCFLPESPIELSMNLSFIFYRFELCALVLRSVDYPYWNRYYNLLQGSKRQGRPLSTLLAAWQQVYVLGLVLDLVTMLCLQLSPNNTVQGPVLILLPHISANAFVVGHVIISLTRHVLSSHLLRMLLYR